jgi:hypothetical protein
MRRRVAFLALPALVLALVATTYAQTPAAPVNVAGKWQVAMELSIGTSNPVLTLKQDGDKITGTYAGRYGESKLTGKLGTDRQLQFQVALEAEGQSAAMYFAGEVAADGQMITKGTVQIDGLGEGTWVAKRAQ